MCLGIVLYVILSSFLPSRPQAEFYIYGWLIKIYSCFSAKPENCGEGIFRLRISAVYQICG